MDRVRECLGVAGSWLHSLMLRHLGDDVDRYYVREAEFSFNALAGFNFGDAEMHNERFIEAVQRRCHFEPGEWIIVWVESEAVYRGYQRHVVMDAAVGVVERGTYRVKDAVWLPDGPIPFDVTLRREGYVRARRRPAAGPERAAVSA